MVIIEDVLLEVGKLGLWLQALGVIVILWLIFQLIAFFYNLRRMREIHEIRQEMRRIEVKIDKLVARKK